MNKKIIFEEIKRLSEVINEQTAAITSYTNVVPLIEIDIVLDNIKKLYQCYKDLSDCSSKPKNIVVDKKSETDKVISNVEHKFDEEIVNTPNVELSNKTLDEKDKKLDEKEIISEEITEQVIANQPQNVQEAEPTDLSFDKNEPATDLFSTTETEKEKVQQPSQRKKSKTTQSQGLDLFAENNNKPIVADKFKDDKKSLNDIIAEQANNNSIASKMQQSPITDLKTAIRINEKFLFINNLFDGNMQDYNIFIDALNEKQNLNEANEFINLCKEKNEWDINNESYLMLIDLVSRRFL